MCVCYREEEATLTFLEAISDLQPRGREGAFKKGSGTSAGENNNKALHMSFASVKGGCCRSVTR